ncbi:PREDICTED: uncharacterized protein LOC105143873 [Acromyrmex echinatior]|uniref:uncharacterized protein LOC105143873 n=1 Tax=Acromyrmex echinatior TaxID=103372 RepID=UPI000580F120|nr:PREDICTED: uncharacterized protein LOC105143873 [Acromyrmex echinatior]
MRSKKFVLQVLCQETCHSNNLLSIKYRLNKSKENSHFNSDRKIPDRIFWKLMKQWITSRRQDVCACALPMLPGYQLYSFRGLELPRSIIRFPAVTPLADEGTNAILTKVKLYNYSTSIVLFNLVQIEVTTSKYFHNSCKCLNLFGTG